MLTLIFSHLLIFAPDCNFQTAFEKGQQDAELRSYGANIDRFCSFATDEDRKNFPKYYDLGRQYGPTLKKADIHSIPKNQSELDSLLKEANLSTVTKELLNRAAAQPSTSPSPTNQEVQELKKKIGSLEEENRRLSDKVEESSRDRRE